jgi:hypothetical protein
MTLLCPGARQHWTNQSPLWDSLDTVVGDYENKQKASESVEDLGESFLWWPSRVSSGGLMHASQGSPREFCHPGICPDLSQSCSPV